MRVQSTNCPTCYLDIGYGLRRQPSTKRAGFYYAQAGIYVVMYDSNRDWYPMNQLYFGVIDGNPKLFNLEALTADPVAASLPLKSTVSQWYNACNALGECPLVKVELTYAWAMPTISLPY